MTGCCVVVLWHKSSPILGWHSDDQG